MADEVSTLLALSAFRGLTVRVAGRADLEVRPPSLPRRDSIPGLTDAFRTCRAEKDGRLPKACTSLPVTCRGRFRCKSSPHIPVFIKCSSHSSHLSDHRNRTCFPASPCRDGTSCLAIIRSSGNAVDRCQLTHISLHSALLAINVDGSTGLHFTPAQCEKWQIVQAVMLQLIVTAVDIILITRGMLR